MSSRRHAGGATVAHPPASRTLDRKNDATDGSEGERKTHVALWCFEPGRCWKRRETFCRLITQLGDPDTSTRRGRRRCFVSCPFHLYFFPRLRVKKKTITTASGRSGHGDAASLQQQQQQRQRVQSVSSQTGEEGTGGEGREDREMP